MENSICSLSSVDSTQNRTEGQKEGAKTEDCEYGYMKVSNWPIRKDQKLGGV